MKKIFILAFIIFTPSFMAFADFNKDLYFGMQGNNEVLNLQQFLTDQNLYLGPINGNFYSLTKAGVIKFQKSYGIVNTGYFGTLTRAKANEILSLRKPPKEGQIENIKEQIKSLQTQLNALLASLASEQATSTKATATTTVNSSASTTSPQAASQTPQEPASIIISGGLKNSFPDYAMQTTYLGPFSIKNNSGELLNLQQIEIKIIDNMNSPFNRGKQVHFILRDGTTTNANMISDTKFTFVSSAPQTDTPWVSILDLPASKVYNQGDIVNYGLWMDGFDYVINGDLKIDFSSLLTTSNNNQTGSFEFEMQR